MTGRIDPWRAELPENYARLMEEFGISSFEEILPDIPDPMPIMRRRIVFGHRDFRQILERMVGNEDFAVMTGLMPSGKMHLGHKMVIDQLIWYQRKGAKMFLCVADLEAYSARGLSLTEARRIAVEEYLANYDALGLDLTRCRVYFQSEDEHVKRLAFLLSKRVTLSELRAIYGFTIESNLSSLFYPMIDVADILHPQLPDFCGPIPTVVPVGIDQDPHLRLARDMAGRFQKEFGFIPPSATYHKLLPGLIEEKMSSSRPEGAIFLTDDDETVRRKILNAFTGGKPTAVEQRREGGNPDICRVFDLYFYHLIPDDRRLLEVKEMCREGRIICGECKQMAIELLLDFLRGHRVKYARSLERVRNVFGIERNR
jgi:tryptophanyl-tRNA synthetase